MSSREVEKWYPVFHPTYKDFYEVSTLGRVRSKDWSFPHPRNPEHLTKSMGLLEGRYTTSGEERKNHKLDWDKVRYIRENKGKLSQSYLAELFGVCKTTIARIQRNEKWKESNNAI